jgi:hypothetical protein
MRQTASKAPGGACLCGKVGSVDHPGLGSVTIEDESDAPIAPPLGLIHYGIEAPRMPRDGSVEIIIVTSRSLIGLGDADLLPRRAKDLDGPL